MLHQSIPLYNGNQPYIYACYSPEDDALVFSVLARMYNEGFRIWSAGAAGVEADFRALQRMNSCAYIIMFMSSSLLERMRAGDPELTAAARSSLLRVVVNLDDAEYNNNIFALSVPEQVEYKPANDAAFWLYVYSSDCLERCRGPWPEKKLMLRDATFEDVSAENLDDEYRRLTAIMTGHVEATAAEAAPAPVEVKKDAFDSVIIDDGLIYAPLGKVKSVKTKLDRDFDDMVDLIDQYVVKQEAIVEECIAGQNRTKTLAAGQTASDAALSDATETAAQEAVAFANVSLTPIEELPAWSAEWDSTASAAEAPVVTIDAFPTVKELAMLDPAGPKADVVITPDENTQPAEGTESDSSTTTEPETLLIEASKPVVAENTTDDAAVIISESTFELAEAEIAADCIQPVSSMVQVMVRRQPAPKHVSVSAVMPVAQHRAQQQRTSAIAHRVSRSYPEPRAEVNLLPSDITTTGDFERYIREIALNAINDDSASSMEEITASARKHAHRQPAAQPAAAVVYEAAAQEAAPAAAAADNTSDNGAKASSARKSRYPHNSNSLLGSVLKNLRQERAAQQSAEESEEEPSVMDDSAPAKSETAELAAPAMPLHSETSSRHEVDPTLFSYPASAAPKGCRGASKKRCAAPSLQLAIEKFVEKDVKTPIVVVPRKA